MPVLATQSGQMYVYLIYATIITHEILQLREEFYAVIELKALSGFS